MAKSFPKEEFYDWARWVQAAPVEHRQYHELTETLDYLQTLLKEHVACLCKGDWGELAAGNVEFMMSF